MPWRRNQEPDRPTEFWQEAKTADRADLRRYAVRWAMAFALLIAGMFFVLWRSSSAVHFGSSRVEARTAATYRVIGQVVDTAGRPVAWARVADDPGGKPPLFETAADRHGNFELLTIAEPHDIVAVALGYRESRVQVGKSWYLWMPSGDQRVRITLTPSD